jgi:hypothetical protein
MRGGLTVVRVKSAYKFTAVFTLGYREEPCCAATVM